MRYIRSLPAGDRVVINPPKDLVLLEHVALVYSDRMPAYLQARHGYHRRGGNGVPVWRGVVIGLN